MKRMNGEKVILRLVGEMRHQITIWRQCSFRRTFLTKPPPDEHNEEAEAARIVSTIPETIVDFSWRLLTCRYLSRFFSIA